MATSRAFGLYAGVRSCSWAAGSGLCFVAQPQPCSNWSRRRCTGRDSRGVDLVCSSLLNRSRSLRPSLRPLNRPIAPEAESPLPLYEGSALRICGKKDRGACALLFACGLFVVHVWGLSSRKSIFKRKPGFFRHPHHISVCVCANVQGFLGIEIGMAGWQF